MALKTSQWPMRAILAGALLLAGASVVVAQPAPGASTGRNLPVDRFTLPPGFKVEVWQAGVQGARTLVLGPKGTLFVGTSAPGRVYAIPTTGERRVRTIAQGLTAPNGLAIRDGALYVAAVDKVFRFDAIEDTLDAPKATDISRPFALPSDRAHGWRFIAFGPDGKLYIPVGAPCNICDRGKDGYAMIRRYNPDGSGMEVVARGVRNSVGFDWHPTTRQLWFTDNGRDNMGDDGPEDELNRLPAGKEGADFGYPFCHAQGIPDPDYRRNEPCADVVLPATTMGPHAAALGMTFYTGTMFPAEYRNAAFVARRGSWNRTKKFGSDLAVVKIDSEGRAQASQFMGGLLDEARNEHTARLVAVLQMPDGALLVSDELNGAIYRISYAKPN